MAQNLEQSAVDREPPFKDEGQGVRARTRNAPRPRPELVEDKPFPTIRKPVPVSKSGPLRAPKPGTPVKPLPRELTGQTATQQTDVSLDSQESFAESTNLDFLDLDEDASWLDKTQPIENIHTYQELKTSNAHRPKLWILGVALLASAGLAYFLYPQWQARQLLVKTDQRADSTPEQPDTDQQSVTLELVESQPSALDTVTPVTLNQRFREQLARLEALMEAGEIAQADELLTSMDRTLYGYGAPEFSQIEARIETQRASSQGEEELRLAQNDSFENSVSDQEGVLDPLGQGEILRREADRAAAEQQAKIVSDQQQTQQSAVEEQAARELAEQQEAQRLAEEQAARELAEQQEAQRLAEEQAARELAEQQEAQRLAEEQAARELAEQQEAQRLAEEQAARELAEQQEAQRLAQLQAARELAEQQEAQRLAEEQAARELAEQQLEAQRLSDEQAARELAEQQLETQRLAQEQAARELAEQQEAQRLAEERAARELAQQQEEQRLANAQAAEELSGPLADRQLDDEQAERLLSAEMAVQQRIMQRQELERVTAIAEQTKADRATQERARQEQLSRAQAALQSDAPTQIASVQPSPETVRSVSSAIEVINVESVPDVPQTISDSELQSVYRRFDELQRAIRDRDIQAVIRLTDQSVAKIQQFQQMFLNNVSIDARIKNISTRDASGEIQGVLVITRLERADGVVTGPPLDLASVQLTSRRDEDGWSAIQW